MKLHELRENLGMTQLDIAKAMDRSQSNICRFEKKFFYDWVDELRRYVEALGGELEIRIVFPDNEVILDLDRPA